MAEQDSATLEGTALHARTSPRTAPMVQQEREQAGREKKLADKHAELSTSRREGAESASKRSKQAATAWTPTRQVQIEDCVAASLLESTHDDVSYVVCRVDSFLQCVPFLDR